MLSLASGVTMTPEEIEERIAAESQAQTEGEETEALVVWKEVKELSPQLTKLRKEATEWKAKTAAVAQPPTLEAPPLLSEEEDLSQLNAQLVELRSALDASQVRLLEDSGSLAKSPERISELIQLIAANSNRLLEVPVPPAGGGSLEEALRQQALLTKEIIESELATQRAERKFLQQELDVLPEQIRLRRLHNERLSLRQEELQQQIAEKRRREAKHTDTTLEQSFQQLATIPPLVELLNEVRALNKERTRANGLQSQIKKATADERNITRVNQRIQGQESSAKQKIALLESVGLGIDTDTGILLREQRALLPSTAALQEALQERVESAVKVQIELVDLQDKLANHPLFSEQEQTSLVAEYEGLEAEQLDSLLAQRQSLLEVLIEEYRVLKASLDRANVKARETINRIENYSNFLDERLLWSKSTSMITFSEPKAEWENLLTLFSSENLIRAWESIRGNWFACFLPSLVLTTLILFSLVRRKRLREIERLGSEQAARRKCTSIRPTIETIVSSGLIAFSFPGLFFLFAILIDEPAAYQRGFLNAGLFLFVASLIYRFSRPGTLFESHFRFSEPKCRRVHQTLRLFIPLMVPLVFAVGALGEGSGSGFSGRVVFIVTMSLVAFMAHQIFYPKHSIVGASEKVSLLVRASYLLAVGLPLGFIIGAGLGFFSSVLTLRAQVLATVGVLLGAFIVIHFFTRWILVSRRKLAILQALQRREASLAERTREESGLEPEEGDVLSLEEVKAQAVDVVEVEEQTVQLLRFGVYFSVVFTIFSIWSSSLTALSILDQKPLWPNAQKTISSTNSVPAAGTGLLLPSGGVETSAEAEAFAELVAAPSADFVSWQDLLFSLLIFLLTFIAARNVPGFLSLVVFSRLRLGPGGNFAFTTIVKYFIVLFGVVIALNKIGITWDKVQWLAAAITLGIGFGLQEIFANFVAGLILLFERPIRIGDIVTVGNISGKVTEIKIRATTIQQFNNRDLVVPNKDFITNQLTNWTLRDGVLRFDVLVGIAYGSDSRKAEEILTQIVSQHPNVLEEPAPQVIFNAFGASTLDFIVRGHVGQVGNLVSTQHDLRFQIEEAFREADIEIAFPQQDIHIRSLPEGFGKTLTD